MTCKTEQTLALLYRIVTDILTVKITVRATCLYFVSPSIPDYIHKYLSHAVSAMSVLYNYGVRYRLRGAYDVFGDVAMFSSLAKLLSR
jgi:hypothetical protein